MCVFFFGQFGAHRGKLPLFIRYDPKSVHCASGLASDQQFSDKTKQNKWKNTRENVIESIKPNYNNISSM